MLVIGWFVWCVGYYQSKTDQKKPAVEVHFSLRAASGSKLLLLNFAVVLTCTSVHLLQFVDALQQGFCCFLSIQTVSFASALLSFAWCFCPTWVWAVLRGIGH
jgi:hypothetical protein